MVNTKEKRTSCLLYPPKMYCCEPRNCPYCGSKKIWWSEFKHNLACLDCQKDFPITKSVFDGPIPEYTSLIMGVRFDTYDVKTGEVHWQKDVPRPWEKEYRKIRNNSLETFGGVVESNFNMVDKVMSKIPIAFLNGIKVFN